jgi:hypothetical protein
MEVDVFIFTYSKANAMPALIIYPGSYAFRSGINSQHIIRHNCLLQVNPFAIYISLQSKIYINPLFFDNMEQRQEKSNITLSVDLILFEGCFNGWNEL